jgi:hypothetical protein
VNDDKVRDIALSAAGLSDASLKAIRDMIDNARAIEASSAQRGSRPSKRK